MRFSAANELQVRLLMCVVLAGYLLAALVVSPLWRIALRATPAGLHHGE